MSYDLTAFRVEDGVEPAVTYARIRAEEERNCADLDAWVKRPVSEAAHAEMRRVAEAPKTWHRQLEEFQVQSSKPWIEVNDEDHALQFIMGETHVDVHGYFGDRPHELMNHVRVALDTFAAQDYAVYDPQLGRFVTSADFEDMEAIYVRVTNSLPQDPDPNGLAFDQFKERVGFPSFALEQEGRLGQHGFTSQKGRVKLLPLVQDPGYPVPRRALERHDSPGIGGLHEAVCWVRIPRVASPVRKSVWTSGKWQPACSQPYC